jgi:hypothetical protein
MTTDLDCKLTSALLDAATTTTFSDDALASIFRRADHRSRPPRRRRRIVVTALAVVAGAAGAGTAYAVVADRLEPDQAQLVDDMLCDISSENARLVASTTGRAAPSSTGRWTALFRAGISCSSTVEPSSAAGAAR